MSLHSTRLPARDPVDTEGLPPNLQEALARCEFLVEQHRPFGLVTGPAGVGKSRLLSRLQQSIVRPSLSPPLHIDLTAADELQFLSDLADALAVGLVTGRRELFRAIQDRLSGIADCGGHQLLLLDHLDDAHPQVLQTLAQLLRSPAAIGTLTIIAAVRNLQSPAVAALQQDFGWLRIELQPLEATQSAHSARQLLRRAGRHERSLPPDAVPELQRLTAGNPRQVQRLVELARLALDTDLDDSISPAALRASARELAVSAG